MYILKKLITITYDNLLLGHFDAAKMILRTVVENNVCLDVLMTYKDEEVWKYYFVQSVRRTYLQRKTPLSSDQQEAIDFYTRELKIEKEFFERRKSSQGKELPAYVDKNYGWTYKVNKDKAFNFTGLCNLVKAQERKDFKYLSIYSHGTDIIPKFIDGGSLESVLNVMILIYIGLYRFVNTYCLDIIDDAFYVITEELESLFYDDIEYFEA